MRWRAHYFLHPSSSSEENQETFGFRSKKSPPQIPELNEFESKMASLVQNIEFKPDFRPTEFQKNLSDHTKAIGKDDKLFVPADKTTNFYIMEKKEYKGMLKKSIEKEYKKAPAAAEIEINKKAKVIAENLHIENRVEKLAKKNSFVTLKDHKDNFLNNPTCRLINPTKSEIRRVSKEILDKINAAVVHKTSVQQWKNTRDALDWFKKIPDKEEHSFVVFDIVNFYPSISQDLLDKALTFASSFIDISAEDRDIIMHAKQSLLFNENVSWVKKKSPEFDVTMGSYDGAETCELVGSYLLWQLPPSIRNRVGLYRDDGLGAFSETPQQIERIKKEICKVFSSNHLKITIEANKKIVNFLDVTLDLQKKTYEPYSKPNDSPLYVHSDSNHPPSILKNIPVAVNRRLNELSCNNESFRKAAPIYQRALDESGYKHQLEFEPTENEQKRDNKRSRKITWFNPPYSMNVSTNVGRRFLNIVKECFPDGHRLKKIFNKNTLKVSYSCMPNLDSKIKSHNKVLLENDDTKKADTTVKLCNCRDRTKCPLDGKCLTKEVVYRATVVSAQEKATYVGITGDEFKTRYRNHLSSFKNESKRNSTELSKFIWTLKDRKADYTLTWDIIARAKAYSSGSRYCNLCVTEKFFIMCKRFPGSLNKRSELISTCRHVNKHLIRNS